MKQYSIHQYVARLTFIPLIGIAVGLEMFFLYSHFTELDRHVLERGELIASQLASSSEYGVASNNLPFLQNIAHDVSMQQDVRGLVILNSSSSTLAESGNLSSPVKTVLVDIKQAMPINPDASIRYSKGSLWISHRIIPETVKLDEFETVSTVKPLGTAIIEISLERNEKLKSKILWYTIAATVIFLALTGFIVSLASRRITRPIRSLSNSIRAIADGDLGTRTILRPEIHELNELSTNINKMAVQLQENQSMLEHRIGEATLELRRKIQEVEQAQEALLSAKLQAEQANQAKSKFLAAVSHDLRQPIHAQGLFLEALSHTELSAHQNKLLANARAASDASSEMLSTLLDFSRIEAGVVKPQLRPFRLQPMLNKVENELAPQADMKGIVYRTRETNLEVRSDPALVELILRNLVSNAIRYTWHGGLLVACRKHGSQVLLEVWDTGIGIAPEYQEDIFREFFQLDNPERGRIKGLGLGLAIVKGLARTLGHELSLASTPQRGSVFRLALPVATGSLPAKQTGWTQNKTLLPNTRVLVIDDDETVLAGMGHLLREWGVECDTAESIEDALALARAHAPDMVICDYRLREQRTGLDAIAALRELLGDAFPALLITGDTAPEPLREAQSSGIPMLHKPVSPSQLHRTLMEVLEVFKRRVVLE